MLGARLRAGHTWTEPASAGPGDMLPLIYDAVEVHAEENRLLAGCTEKCPDVPVTRRVVRASAKARSARSVPAPGLGEHQPGTVLPTSSASRSIAAPRRAHDRNLILSATSGSARHSPASTGWQYSAFSRGQAHRRHRRRRRRPEVRNTSLSSNGTRSRHPSRESGSGLAAISKSTAQCPECHAAPGTTQRPTRRACEQGWRARLPTSPTRRQTVFHV